MATVTGFAGPFAACPECRRGPLALKEEVVSELGIYGWAGDQGSYTPVRRKMAPGEVRSTITCEACGQTWKARDFLKIWRQAGLPKRRGPSGRLGLRAPAPRPGSCP